MINPAVLQLPDLILLRYAVQEGPCFLEYKSTKLHITTISIIIYQTVDSMP